MITIWTSTEEHASWLIESTILKNLETEVKTLYESDASKPKHFHRVPTHLKNILYLDAPDIVLEKDGSPFLAVEISTEAGTGHNVFQRFGRIAAAVENGVPAFYIYPRGVVVWRKRKSTWDRLNPLILTALEKVMRIYDIPALFFAYPDHQSDSSKVNRLNKGLRNDPKHRNSPESASAEMQVFFTCANRLIENALRGGEKTKLLKKRELNEVRDQMIQLDIERRREMGNPVQLSPQTSCIEVPTSALLKALQGHFKKRHDFGDLLGSREKTVIYGVNASFRGDPYPGALVSIDYLECREGMSFEERDKNLVMAWGKVGYRQGANSIVLEAEKPKQSIAEFMEPVKMVYEDKNKVLLNRSFKELSVEQISRYFMQVRFGTTFTKSKHLRIYSYFCDAILFDDGALWREG